MAHIHIEVDGAVLMDGNPGDWTSNPPEMDKLQLKGGTPDPWMVALMPSVANAVTKTLANMPHHTPSLDTHRGRNTRPRQHHRQHKGARMMRGWFIKTALGHRRLPRLAHSRRRNRR